MKFTALSIAMAASILTFGANAQSVKFNGTWSCPSAEGSYCAGKSLVTNWIFHCINGIVYHGGNCDDTYGYVDQPGGYNHSQCYETNHTAGDAVCSMFGSFWRPDPRGRPTLLLPLAALSSTTTEISVPATTICATATHTSHSTPTLIKTSNASESGSTTEEISSTSGVAVVTTTPLLTTALITTLGIAATTATSPSMSVTSATSPTPSASAGGASSLKQEGFGGVLMGAMVVLMGELLV